jgi:predicted ATP-grasp superfamily ATP-dependent carboligase
MGTESVVVVPADDHVALSVIRSLGRNGIPVTAITTGRDIAQSSRYCRRVIATTADGLGSSLLNLVKTEPGSYVIGLGDLEILTLNQRRDELQHYATLLFPDRERFALVLNKMDTLALAQQVGVPVPKTVDMAEELALSHCDALQFPLVIKPRQKGGLPFRAFKVRYAQCFRELERELDQLKPHRRFLLVQEYVAGHGVGVELLIHEGRTVMAFQHRRIREDPPSGGVGVCCESEGLHPELLQHSQRLLKAMRWQGVAMVEYRMDPSTGRFALMEVNGRFWGSLPLALHAGADFPIALVRCHSFGAYPEPPPYRYPVRCRLLAGDTKCLIRVLWRRSGSPLHAIALYLRDFRPSVKYYKWSWDDPRPAFHAIFQRMLSATKRVLAAGAAIFGSLRRRRTEIGAA